MARIEFELDSPLRPSEVLANLVDFGERRPALWPAIDPGVYRVHAVGEGWAEVTEGTSVLGGIWARERYEWSDDGAVRATIQESNFWHPGGTWTLRAQPGADGGSRLTVQRDRRARGARARLLETVLRVVGTRMLASELRKAPALGIVARPERCLGPRRSGNRCATERSLEEDTMDSDRIEGKRKQTEGSVQETWGETKDKAGDAWDDVKDKVDDLGDEKKDDEEPAGSR